MKKLIIILVGCFLLISEHLSAQTISEDTALQIANRFMGMSYPSTKAASAPQMKSVKVSLSRSLETPCYFFNASNNKGFVIVSANEESPQILAYSTTSIIDPVNIPPAMEEWLDVICKPIGDNPLNTTPIPSARNNRQTLSLQDISRVYLSTAQWGQSSPYNLLCPMGHDSPTLTGCVATSLAIIMKYHRWPICGNGVLQAYDFALNDKRIYRDSYELGKPYDWDSMLDDYSNAFTATQAEAVAQLMFDLGYMVKMEYGEGASLAGFSNSNIPPLVENMGYDDCMVYYASYTLPYQTWIEMIKEDIDSGMPVWASGGSAFDAHAYVIDGYDSNDYLSINWGWGGASNGYYCFNPSSISYEESNYRMNPSFILHIHPFVSDDHSKPVLSAGGFLEVHDEIVIGQGFNLLGISPIFLDSYATFSGDIAAVVVDGQDNIKEVIGKFENCSCLSHSSQYVHTPNTMSCTITKPIEIGDKIKLAFRSKGESNWHLILYDYDYAQCEIPLKETCSLEEGTWVEYHKEGITPLGDGPCLILSSFDHVFIPDYFDDMYMYGYTLYDEDGNSINTYDASTQQYIHSPFKTDFSKLYIMLNRMKPGRYTIKIESRLESIEFSFVI